MAADDARRRRHGARITFVRVAHLSLEEAEREDVSWLPAAGEVRLSGPLLDVTRAAAAIRRVVARAGGVPVTGFSLADAEAAADSSRLDANLTTLREAGLVAIAEAPLDRLRAPEAALAAVLRAGLGLARLTVDESPAEAREALVERAIHVVQSAPAVRAFAPLPRRGNVLAPTTGFEDVRLIALARLLVPVEHVQVDWALYGPKLAQVALTFGASDVDDVSALEDTGEGRRRAPLEEIRRNITAASGEPVERDGRFEPRG
jgi:hypothetical protein